MLNFILQEDSGQAMVEYTIIVALIALACISAFTAIGNAVNDHTAEVNDGLTDDSPCTVEHPCLK